MNMTVIAVTAIICLTLIALCWMSRNDNKGGGNNGNP